MKKLSILLVTICFIQFSYGQKISPFKYKNKWGIVDNEDNEVIKPTYKDLKILGDFAYAQFDDSILYNLKTGVKINSFGKAHTTEFEINNKNYYFFTNTKKSVLIDFKSKDTIHFSEPYQKIENVWVYDTKLKKSVPKLLLAYLDSEHIKLLKAEKEITPLFKQKLKLNNVRVIENIENDNIGLYIKDKKNINLYNSDFNLIKKIKSSSVSEEELSSIYNTSDAYYSCVIFNEDCIEEVAFARNSWRISPSGLQLSEKYYINSKNHLKNRKDKAINYKVLTTFFNERFKVIKIKEKDLEFFSRFDYLNAMVPLKYLK